nr:uncharacterized protein LOC107414610 [Ziziphus jujuba var. spinosa]
MMLTGRERGNLTHRDTALVQNLIERCLQLYMSRNEVIATLLSHAKIKPQFTDLVWQRLEEENADFFKGYYVKLKLKDQTCFFNYLLHQQYHMTRQNGRQHLPVDSLPPPQPSIQSPSNPISSTGYHRSNSSMGTIPSNSSMDTMSDMEDRNHTLENFISLLNSDNG